ncbi:site-specific integrase [Luteimonas lutimaris]|uniref:Tyrosine-type recombinase/integrase n=1 Tax=Luteimonas lutimaris TaxID=698645 RepID=A0ABP7MTX5_9GAMM
MKSKLSPGVADAAKPKAKPYEIHDTGLRGLLLRVQPSGVKSFIVSWDRGKRRTLGRYPVMTVAGARKAALAALSESAEHGAPLAVIAASKPQADTLGDFIRDHYAGWAKANQKAGQATVDAIESVFGDLYDRTLASLSPFDFERIKAKRLKDKIKPATVNRDLSRIRGALSRAVDWGMIPEHPMRTVKQAKGGDDSRVRYLTAQEEKALRGALVAREGQRRASRQRHNAWHAARGTTGHPEWPAKGYTDHLMPMVLLALNTGMRRGELLGLEWASVNLPGKLLTVTAGNAKSRKARHLPLNAEALDVLTRWKKQASGRLVFPSPGGGRMGNINSSWEALCTEAKLADFRFHDLRHTFASRLVMKGVDLNTVRELLGHSDIRMTLRYAHLAPDKLAEAVELLGT